MADDGTQLSIDTRLGDPELNGDEEQKRTLLAPAQALKTAPRADGRPRPARELPPDLLLEASKRLQILALLLASTLFLANFLGHLLDILVGDIEFFLEFSNWAPGVATILVSLLVYGLARSQALAPARLMDVGLVFGAVGSFGIATSEFWGVYSEAAYRDTDFFGLSWVAVWMLSYTVIIPNRPAKTLLSLIVSASSVSIVIGLSVKFAGSSIPVGPGPFFFGAVFPYLVCTGMAYVGARVVYRLGTAVSRARELGSYRLIDILGRGGMGEVWRAQHRMLARPAAIKLIRPEALGDNNVEDRKTVLGRFEREAQATASLRSPHTIELYDFGVSDTSTGSTPRRWWRSSGRCPPGERCTSFCRCVTRWARPTPRDWCIATSSLPTYTCAATGARSTSSRCSTSGSSNRATPAPRASNSPPTTW